MTNEKEEVVIDGYYRHFKGNIYRVTGIATHSETFEKLVIYKPLSRDITWVRPLKMFTEKVEVDGQLVDRFEYMGLASASPRCNGCLLD